MASDWSRHLRKLTSRARLRALGSSLDKSFERQRSRIIRNPNYPNRPMNISAAEDPRPHSATLTVQYENIQLIPILSRVRARTTGDDTCLLT